MCSHSPSTSAETFPLPVRQLGANSLRVPLPYRSRPLTLRELQKQDVYSYYSPKCDGLVRVVGLARLAAGLELEWEPSVATYLERPRTLLVDDAEIEFSFFHRLQSGREVLTLVVSAIDALRSSGAHHQHRKAEAILTAAEAASLPLRFLFETDLTQRSIRVANQFRLLPSVQAAHRVANRQALRQRILEVAGARARLRIDQIAEQLGSFHAPDLHCGVADLLHSGELAADWDKPIGLNALVWRIVP